MIEIKFKGPHSILVDFPTYMGIVNQNDTIKVKEEFFKEKLKHRKHNNKKIWVEVKTEKPETKEELPQI